MADLNKNHLGDVINILGGAGGAALGTIIPGLKLYHGSPKENLTYLRPSQRGPLGPGVYSSDWENVANRYKHGGRLYELPEESRDIYWGQGIRNDEQYYGAKNDRRRLIEAASPVFRDDVKNIVTSGFPQGSEGYREFWDLSRLYGDQTRAQDLFKKAGFHGLNAQVDGPETLLFKGQHLEPGATPEQFAGLGDMQRGGPEHAMLRVQHTMGGGVLNPVVEHAGDLVHRMTHNAPYNIFGYEPVESKVRNVLTILTNPYGFEREMGQNIANTSIYRDVSQDSIRDSVTAALKRFGDEHAKLPAYNEAQDIANNINVDLGNQNWEGAIKGLNRLKQNTTSPEVWDAYASQGLKK